MDCRTARLLLDFARPRPAELAAEEAAALEGHLTGCPECDSLARTERQLDGDDALLAAYREHFGITLRHVPSRSAPPGLVAQC